VAKLTDLTYLRHSQYRDTSNLLARSNLHERFGRGDWFKWISSHAPWPHRGRILEVGCGNGRFWIDAAELVAEEASVVVTDLSYSMVRETCAADGPATAGSVVALPQLPFADGAFDIATSVYLFHELPRNARRNVLAELLQKRCGAGSLATVFPDLTPEALGAFTARA
jgi:SAM-dependent methyltransferase